MITDFLFWESFYTLFDAWDLNSLLESEGRIFVVRPVTKKQFRILLSDFLGFHRRFYLDHVYSRITGRIISRPSTNKTPTVIRVHFPVLLLSDLREISIEFQRENASVFEVFVMATRIHVFKEGIFRIAGVSVLLRFSPSEVLL